MSVFARGAAAAPATGPRIVIRPTSGPISPRLKEVWEYRELFWFLVLRDIKVRYAQTLLGAFWTLFQPLGMMLVFTYAFSKIANIDTAGTPYPLFALAGLALWMFVSRAVLTGATSLVANIPLVTKTSCPRLIIPLAAVVSVLVDFVVALALFLVVALGYGRVPTCRFGFVPLILLLAFVLGLGLSVLLAALNVRYREVGPALPFVVQLWFFLSPVAYSLHTPGVSWATIVQAFNPLVGMIEAFRWALLGTLPPHGLLVVSIGVSVLIFAAGVVYFSAAERTVADDV